MGTEIKIWQVVGNSITPVEDTSYASTGTEEQLEDWIRNCPNILGDDLLVIDRQRHIENVGFLDLLCIDANGTLVLVELKRDRAPREAVAQVLDYASWLSTASPEQIRRNAEEFLKAPLDEKFSEVFSRELEELNPENHKLLLVAATLDAGAERIISYLARKYSVDINAVFFKYTKLKSGEQILVRTVLVPDAVFKTSEEKWTTQELLDLSSERNNLELVKTCRELVKDEYLWDKPSRAYGGSFRFWGHREKGSNPRMVLGLNVSGDRCSTPKGQLDVWIPVKSLAEISGSDEPSIRKFLQGFSQVEIQSTIDVVVRLKSNVEAEKLVNQIKKWLDVREKGASIGA
jgi:endonuclease NucS-like protein